MTRVTHRPDTIRSDRCVKAAVPSFHFDDGPVMTQNSPTHGGLEVDPSAPDDLASLRADIRVLGELLGATLVRQDSPELLTLVEQVRALARTDLAETSDLLDGVELSTAIALSRAFSTYFHLANIAEQVHRSRLLRTATRTTGSTGACCQRVQNESFACARGRVNNIKMKKQNSTM